MPSKSKRRAPRQKPSVVCESEPTPPYKTLDSYFPVTPPTDNNNDSKLEVTSETVFYYHSDGVQEDITNKRENADILSVGCLPTPEVSPEKFEQAVKSEPAAHSIPERVKAEESKELTSSSSSHTSNSSDCSASSTDTKPKRRGISKPVKAEDGKPQQNKLTDFFPVRKSSRKTAKELRREHDEMLRNMILDECEDGLKIVHYEGKGRGVEATTTFAKGDFIVEYAGDLVELKEAKFREEHYKKDISYGCYMYFFNHKGKSYCIDATRESGKMGRLLNHSRTTPNCVTRTLDIGDSAYLILVAGRDIEIGEELVYDYGDRSKEAIENNPWLKD